MTNPTRRRRSGGDFTRMSEERREEREREREREGANICFKCKPYGGRRTGQAMQTGPSSSKPLARSSAPYVVAPSMDRKQAHSKSSAGTPPKIWDPGVKTL